MIEEIIMNYLIAKLINVEVFTETPKEHSLSYVRIERTGGSIENHLHSVTMTIQSYGPSLYEAASLNDRVIKAMLAIVELDSISKCSLNAEYNYTDTRTKKYRYQSVFNLIYY